MDRLFGTAEVVSAGSKHQAKEDDEAFGSPDCGAGALLRCMCICVDASREEGGGTFS